MVSQAEQQVEPSPSIRLSSGTNPAEVGAGGPVRYVVDSTARRKGRRTLGVVDRGDDPA